MDFASKYIFVNDDGAKETFDEGMHSFPQPSLNFLEVVLESCDGCSSTAGPVFT
jgi:hypothetical protein